MSDSSRAIKIGIIGCGHVTESWHLPQLLNIRNAKVMAIADIDSEQLKRVADRFYIKHRYTNYRNLLENPDVEAVAVCVPAQFHANVALVVLDAGKPLFIENPFRVEDI